MTNEPKDSSPTDEPVSANTPEPTKPAAPLAKQGFLTESMLKGESLGEEDKKG